MNLAANPFAPVSSMEALYSLLRDAGLGAGWNKPTPSLYPAPRRAFVPAHWSYAIAKPALDAAGRFVSTELAERRKGWQPRGHDFNSGALWKYAQIVGPAEKGAVTHPGGKAETHVYADI